MIIQLNVTYYIIVHRFTYIYTVPTECSGATVVNFERVKTIDIEEWIGHGYINKIEGSMMPECGREKD